MRSLVLVARDIKLHHSVFALPFALISMLWAAQGLPAARIVLWIILACIFARSAAMGFNRWADADIDTRNPRTQSRAIPAGRVSRGFMLGFVVLNVLLFFFAAGMLNRLCLFLAAPCLAVLLGYSYAKRFTSAAHLWLGVALGLAPVGAWVAIRGALEWAPIVLGSAVALWVAGFDILYACQDVEVDHSEQLFSIPARLGVPRALWVSAALHLAAWVGFAAVGWMPGAERLGWAWGAGVVAAGALLAWQHWVVRPGDLSRLNAAFFNANGLLSIGLLLAAGADLFLFR